LIQSTLRAFATAAILLAAAHSAALANYATCGAQVVSAEELSCPDGSMPSFHYGNPPTAAPRAAPSNSLEAQRQRRSFIGVWHTPMEGTGYAHGSDVPGATSMDGRISLRAGDLTLAPGGAFTWNTLSPGFGRWIRMLDNEDWDFLMIDVGGARWRGHLEKDGRLKLMRDEQHIIFCIR
jgi:hypothetical protein